MPNESDHERQLMSEPIETKPAEMKAAPCGAKKSALLCAGIGGVLGAVVGLATNALATYLPLGIVLGFVVSGIMRGGGG